MTSVFFILLGVLASWVCYAVDNVYEEKSNEYQEQARVRALMALPLADLLEVQLIGLASGFQQPTFSAPASTTVITDRDIEAIGARSLQDILETVPGLHLSLSEPHFSPKYNVRGVVSDRNYEILIMVDGVPVRNVVNGGRGLWQPPPVQSISRIEVMRTPGSALYGADALSGVVNIITKTFNEVAGTEVGLRAGRFNTYNPWLLYGGRFNGFQVAFSMDYMKTDGHEETIHDDLQTLLDQATGTSASEAPSRAYLQAEHLNLHANVIKDEWRLDVRHVSSRNLGAGLGMATIISPEEHFNVKDTQINLTYHRSEWKPNWDILAQAGYRHFVEDLNSVYSARPETVRGGQWLPYGAPNEIGSYQHQAHFNLSAIYRGFEQHTMRLGLGYAYLDLYDTPWQFLLDKTVPVMVDVRRLGMTLIPENIRQNRYLFAQDTWRFHPEWELTLGVRHDWYSDFEGETNPRLGLVWEMNPSLTAKILYGTSFRAPSFIEMYAGENQAIVGNPNLKAEKSKTWEIGFDYRMTSDMNTTLTLFDYRVKDKIQQQLIPNPNAGVTRIFSYNNIETLQGNGLEWEGRWRMNSRMSVAANYAYARVENDQGEAGNYPHHQVYLRYDWLLGKNWFLNSSLNWILDRDRPVSSMQPPLADYATLNFSLRYAEWADTYSWHFVAGLRNALDEERREPGDVRLFGDYPKAGREWFSEIRYRF
ncbi:hypothetical protein TPSD3_09905 [Thioflexithrix psekupsensis]|uniref:TonB-dependent receptor n=1 Tax=Thioflexithrix psekupsensis TaxID=1570016 RepID=A0A251X9H5_9GAMM|nr:hypothetical protein TPSD3_09905 [Thioflexithrix psekupsensis]